jgi:hypothetical protein
MLCEYCKINDTILNKNGKTKSRFCSKTCRSAFICEVRKKTNIEKYGVDNPFKSKEIQAKRDATCISKYGVPKVSESPTVMQIIKQKQAETCMRKYGVEFAQQHPLIKEKMAKAWSSYSGNHPFSDPNCRKKREESLLAKWGVKHPILSPEIEKKCRAGFADTIQKQRQEKISAYPELSDAVWLEKNINDIGCVGTAKLIGVGISYVKEAVKEFNITITGKRRSIFEKQVCDFIRQHYQGELITNCKELGSEIDILLPELKLAIECNGAYWHSELNGRGKDFHNKKTLLAAEQNYHLIHIWDYDWTNNKELIKSRLKSLLKVNKVMGARKCTVEVLTTEVAKEFFNKNHIQGSCQSSIRLGLVYDGTILAAMTFGKSRFNKQVEYELLRYANVCEYSIAGGASKLFNYFIKHYSPKSVISYSDRSFNKGKLYEVLNFKFTHSSPPAYYYTKNYSQLESRVKFQKHKLNKLLEIFDSSLSEWDNMQINGYDRIWDCGTDVWLWQSLD